MNQQLASALLSLSLCMARPALAQARLFEEGRISTGNYEAHPAFSPSGDTLYFLIMKKRYESSCYQRIWRGSLLPLKYSAKLQPGETVLINGATGVSGRIAIQVAKMLGAGRVIGTGRNARSLELLSKLGADAVID